MCWFYRQHTSLFKCRLEAKSKNDVNQETDGYHASNGNDSENQKSARKDALPV